MENYIQSCLISPVWVMFSCIFHHEETACECHTFTITLLSPSSKQEFKKTYIKLQYKMIFNGKILCSQFHSKLFKIGMRDLCVCFCAPLRMNLI